MKQKRILCVFAIVLLFGLVGSAMFFNQKSAPEFTISTLNGQTISQSDLKGKVTLINFWATTCSGCIAEIPMLKDVLREFSPQGFQLIAVSMYYDPEDQVRRFVEKNQLPFIVGLDSEGKMSKAFGDIQLTPTSILIDKNGKVIQTIVSVPDEAKLRKLIQSELSKS